MKKNSRCWTSGNCTKQYLLSILQPGEFDHLFLFLRILFCSLIIIITAIIIIDRYASKPAIALIYTFFILKLNSSTMGLLFLSFT
jgi:hypothetical protein